MNRLQIGPAGGYGGRPFDHYDIPENAQLTAIHVYADWVIHALQFDYINAEGRAGSHAPIGGQGGTHHIFYLERDEYLTGISGRAGWYIDSIQFHTNKRESPRYGGSGGERDFSFKAPKAFEISGLFGRADWYIDALGVTARLLPEPQLFAADEEWEVDGQDYESWLALAGEGEPLPASVVVHRAAVVDNQTLEELEDAALAEAIAARASDEDVEGAVDAAVYTQVIEDAGDAQKIAVVLAVAAEMDPARAGEEEPDEIAIMVTDAITTEDDISYLEEEAVETAIDTLLDEMEEEVDEVEVTIYSGVAAADASGGHYAAVVAVARRMAAAAPPAPRSAAVDIGTRVPRPKDLERVEGIGPKIAELLIANGIYDLGDLAAAPAERLREVLLGGGRRFRLADPTTWSEQAALGAAGDWDALAEFQARLKAGRSE